VREGREVVGKPGAGKMPSLLASSLTRRSWNQGGKLPGLRGGPDTHGCSGGNQTDGTGCFSTRLMWRTSGAGEGERGRKCGLVLHCDQVLVVSRRIAVVFLSCPPTGPQGHVP
jgi:hypothetical protein